MGGSHLLTLTRLGIGAFTLADFDVFEIANFNRQVGATMRSVGSPKVDTLAEMALDINPELDLRIYDKPIGTDNASEFLQDADLYLDGLDFFALAARRAVFSACHESGVPAVTAAPLGFSAAVLTFLPGSMSFEDYFQVEGHPENEQYLRFFIGLAPGGLHKKSLVDPSTIDLAGRKGPSTPIGCELCAGIAAGEAVKILLGRGKLLSAPVALQFDAYTGRLTRVKRPGGNKHPLQRLALYFARKSFLADHRN